ncbi:MAG: Bro-N domain-containing protein [Bacteroidales bacterium]|jgi:prophage antirepressor-like protein|nr:Bro-N domain-containing protein [Bacteroidales bacterium]
MFKPNPNATSVQVFKNVKIASRVKHSNRTSTPDCESVKIFSFDHDTIVEVVLINGEPYFVAADVCRALGLVNPTDHIVKSLDNDEHLTYKIYRAGQQRTVNVISESGLYALAVRSTKPNARKFRKWITSEVLPEIRKKGMYLSKETEKALKGEIAKWKSCFQEAMIFVKSANESNKTMLQSMACNADTVRDFIKNYMYPDNRMMHVPPRVFEFVMSLGGIIRSQQQTIDFLSGVKGGVL